MVVFREPALEKSVGIISLGSLGGGKRSRKDGVHPQLLDLSWKLYTEPERASSVGFTGVGVKLKGVERSGV